MTPGNGATTMSARTDPDLARWAREQLGEGPSGPAPSFRHLALQRLGDSDFLPPAHLCHALAVVATEGDPPQAVGDAIRARLREGRSQRVEAFARDFFRIPVARREREWLKQKAAVRGYPALEQRLDLLEPGLKLDPAEPNVLEAGVRRLIGEASAMFLLRPFEAAGARAAF